jgi:serine protease Do
LRSSPAPFWSGLARAMCLSLTTALTVALANPASANQEKSPAADAKDVELRRQSVATGFFISDAGYLVTSHHVVAGFDEILVLMPGRRVLRAALLKEDKVNDLALLKVAAITPFLYLSHSQGVPAGMDVVTIGYPQVAIQGTTPKITRGIVNSNTGLLDDLGSFQFSAEIQKGNSGGPLLGPKGTVVGVVRSKLDAFKMSEKTKDLPQNVNFATKSGRLIDFLKGTPGLPSTRPLDAEQAIQPITIYAELKDAIVPIISRIGVTSGETKKP